MDKVQSHDSDLITYASVTPSTGFASSLELSSGGNTISSTGTGIELGAGTFTTSSLSTGTSTYSIHDYNKVNRTPKPKQSEVFYDGSNNYITLQGPVESQIQWDHSNNLTRDATITYNGSTNSLTTTKSFETGALHVNGASKLTFDKPGRIENVESIQWSNGTKLSLPTTDAGKGKQYLGYDSKTNQLKWYDGSSWADPNNLVSKDVLVELFRNQCSINTITQNQITQLQKEIKMINVHAVWGFSDYLSIFLIALLAIWFAKHIYWRVVLTPIKKLFKFGEKKVKEAEEELKKAEQVWKDND